MTEGPLIVRGCTVCIASRERIDQKKATFVATNPNGMQWFECDEHEPEEHGRVFGHDTSGRTLTPLADWLEKALGL